MGNLKADSMNKADFYKGRKELLERKEKLLRGINSEYGRLVAKFIKANCPMDKGMVYELVSGASRRRGCDRFVVYDITARTLLDNKYAHIIVSGWWLDKDSVPKKWNSYKVFGDVTPIAVFKLSENQENKPVPSEAMENYR